MEEFLNPRQQDADLNEGQADKIRIVLLDPFSKTLIKDPVKGTKCTHPQSFDLKVFLKMICSTRQWKCPICGKDARKMVIDKQAQTVILDCEKMITPPKAIYFYSDGRYTL